MEKENSLEELSKIFRKYILVKELSKYGLELRLDSRLCLGYINGTLEKNWKLSQIVHRMCQMKFLFEYCDLNACFNRALIEKELGFNTNIPLFDHAEIIALRKSNGYPNKWPWLN